MISDRIARLHIQLYDVEPSIWRRVEVPLTSSLKAVHDVIQTVMLFEDYHLFQFEIGDRRYGYPDPEWGDEMRNARNARLGAILARGEARFTYTYDFGDDWRHSVVVEDVVAADPVVDYPRFIEAPVAPRRKMLEACPALKSSSGSWPILPMNSMRPP